MAAVTRSRSSGMGGRHRTTLGYLVLVTALVLGSRLTARAAPDPDAVHLVAEKGLRFEADAQLLVAEGNVRLTYRDLTLEADTLRVDLEYDVVRAEGHVRYRKGSDRLEARSVVYDLKQEAGTFLDVTTTYQGKDLKDDLLVVGSFMESSKSMLRLVDSNLTTCNLAQPHYHLEAREITVYLDDRLEARQVSYFEGRTRLFTLPYLIVPLKKENQFELPRLGYSQTDGWFVKTTYNYYRNPAAYGAYFLDWYQKKGLGLGLKHNYLAGDRPWDAAGWWYLYLKGYRDRNDEEVFWGVDHRQQFGPAWKGTLRGSHEEKYLSSLQKQEAAGTYLQLTQQSPAGLTDLSASYRLTVTETLPPDGGAGTSQLDLRNIRLSFNTAQRLPNDWDWRFAASATRFHQIDKTPYDNLGYQTQIARAFPDFTVRLSAQQQFTPPPVVEGETPPPWNRYTRFPELALETRTLTHRGKPLPLFFTATLSRYEESSIYYPDGRALSMGSLTGRLTGLSYPLASRLTATLNGSSTATYYQNGDYTLGATTGAGLTYRPLPRLSTTLRYNWQDRLGVNPFASTGISPAQSVTGNVNYVAAGLTADFGTGYNLLTGQYQDLVGRLAISRPRLSASGMVSYDPNTGTWRRLSGIYSYQASETKFVKLGAAVNLGTSRVERLDAQAATPLGDLWRAEVTLSYDGWSNRLLRGEVALVRDLHCRELRLSYDEPRREVWLEWRIKALPSQLFRLGAGERLLFDTQSLGGLLSPESATPGVPR